MSTRPLEPADNSELIERLLALLASTDNIHTQLSMVLRTIGQHILTVEDTESIAESMELTDARRAGMGHWMDLVATQVDIQSALTASLDESELESDREKRVRRLTTEEGGT